MTFVDKLLSNGVSDIGAVDRLNVLWRARGIGSNIKNDIHQAVS